MRLLEDLPIDLSLKNSQQSSMFGQSTLKLENMKTI